MSEEQIPYLMKYFSNYNIALHETLVGKKSEWLEPIPFTTYTEFDAKLSKLVSYIKETIPDLYKHLQHASSCFL